LLDPENELRSTGYASDDLIGENHTEPLWLAPAGCLRALPLPVATLPGLAYGPLALHSAFLALGNEPSPLSELSQDPAIRNLLAESP
jgi:hypothetical protein